MINSNSWHNLLREEKTSFRLKDSLINENVLAKNIDYGIMLYSNAIKSEDCDIIINKLEKNLDNKTFFWQGSLVNDQKNSQDSRNCVDFKFKRDHLGKFLPFNQDLFDIHKKVEDSLDSCLNHYESLWHLKMNYKEAFNFVKYTAGKYFKIHGDHGPYYSCTVSAVVYLNDDYEGGEIEFIRHGIKIKPAKGDIILFPSNYVYEHASCEVFSGIKYSVVIMLDYNDLHHKGE